IHGPRARDARADRGRGRRLLARSDALPRARRSAALRGSLGARARRAHGPRAARGAATPPAGRDARPRRPHRGDDGEDPRSETLDARDRRSRAMPRLIELDGSDRRSHALAHDRITLGADAHDDVRLAPGACEPEHAALEWSDEGYRLIALRSPERVRKDGAPFAGLLRDGDVIEVGSA